MLERDRSPPWMISPGRGLRLGVREAEGRVGGRKEEKEESNSLMFLFLLGVVPERDGRGRAGEGLVAEPRTEEENEESSELSLFGFGVDEVEMAEGRRMPDWVGTGGLQIFPEVPAAGVVLLMGICREVLRRSPLGFGLLLGI